MADHHLWIDFSVQIFVGDFPVPEALDARESQLNFLGPNLEFFQFSGRLDSYIAGKLFLRLPFPPRK
jgi:hypothetical protein